MKKTKALKHEEVTKNTPLNASRYIGAYLALLILSTLGTAFGLLGFINIPETMRQFEFAPAYAILTLFSIFIIQPTAVIALVFLWLKRPIGIWLKLATYAASIMTAIVVVFTAQPVIKDLVDQAIVEVKKSNSTLDTSFIESITSFTFYAGLIISIVISIIFGLLWWFVWKKQVEADAD